MSCAKVNRNLLKLIVNKLLAYFLVDTVYIRLLFKQIRKKSQCVGFNLP